jgi:superfamily II DNA or RNA helicase
VHALGAVDAGRRGIVHLPTGAGKTVQVGKVTEHSYHRGQRTLFLHHRRELRTQALKKFRDFGLEPEVEEASSRACKRSLNPVIASVLSLQGSRLRSWPRDAFHLIVTDECHHAAAPAYQTIYEHFTGARSHIGVTATVDRHDRKSLLQAYPDGILYSYSLLDAVLDGWLVRPKAIRLGIRPDLRRCRMIAGDYVASELGVAISGHLADIAESIRAEIGRRRTIVFTPTIASARALADHLQGVGLQAEAVWGSHPDRDRIIAGFRSDECQIIVNVAVLGEGLDVPEVEAVVLCRPTQSRGLYAQMIGRGLRLAPGKSLLRVIDYHWLTRKHQLLMNPTTLLLADELPRVQEFAADREASEDPVADVKRARACYLHALECSAYTREEAWLLAPPEAVTSRTDAHPEWLRPSAKQLQTLRSFGVVGGDRMTRVEAGVAIEVAIRRWKRGLANYSLVRALVDKGILPVEDALRCSDLRAKYLLAPPWWRKVLANSSK